MRDLPKPGEIYTHFKGNRYEVMSIATDTETDEQQVVYKALYGEGQIFVRPLDLFMSTVDRAKYPDAVQEFRFEKEESGKKEQVDENLIKFLDAESCEAKLRILELMENGLTARNLIAMATSLDVELSGDTLAEQCESLKKCLNMRMMFEGERLR